MCMSGCCRQHGHMWGRKLLASSPSEPAAHVRVRTAQPMLRSTHRPTMMMSLPRSPMTLAGVLYCGRAGGTDEAPSARHEACGSPTERPHRNEPAM